MPACYHLIIQDLWAKIYNLQTFFGVDKKFNAVKGFKHNVKKRLLNMICQQFCFVYNTTFAEVSKCLKIPFSSEI